MQIGNQMQLACVSQVALLGGGGCGIHDVPQPTTPLNHNLPLLPWRASALLTSLCTPLALTLVVRIRAGATSCVWENKLIFTLVLRGSDYVTLVTADWSSYFCFSPAPRVETRSQDLPESKAKWAITLQCDTSEASRGQRGKKQVPSLYSRGALRGPHSSVTNMFGRASANEEQEERGENSSRTSATIRC